MNVNDNINMEYEARVMINEEQYLNIRNHYLATSYSKEEIVNENYYFDTEDLKLTNSHKVLRMRKINGSKYELTLKIQGENGAIEINHLLTNKEKVELINNNIISYKPIIDKLSQCGVDPNSIKYITDLKTERLEVKLESCLLVIDKNYFRNKVDFNLEVESDAETRAKSQLLAIIEPFGVTYKKDYINKARRAIYNL
ncbi:MAG: CYTH domain-containing protein [Bacilli bacterium]|nr:CYTH domain-containing protein [Bacilli bacterium]